MKLFRYTSRKFNPEKKSNKIYFSTNFLIFKKQTVNILIKICFIDLHFVCLSSHKTTYLSYKKEMNNKMWFSVKQIS